MSCNLHPVVCKQSGRLCNSFCTSHDYNGPKKEKLKNIYIHMITTDLKKKS
jgi:hypothetical protein